MGWVPQGAREGQCPHCPQLMGDTPTAPAGLEALRGGEDGTSAPWSWANKDVLPSGSPASITPGLSPPLASPCSPPPALNS